MKALTTVFKPFLVILLALGLLSGQAVAGDNPNLLIMGEDADEDTVPRNSRVFKRVLGAVSNQMSDIGFSVFDETAVTLDDFAQGRVRRTDAELIDIARSIQRPPIDVGVIFSIYAMAKDKGYTTKVYTRIEGRMLNVKTGQRLGNFEITSPKEWKAPPKCNRDCILEVIGEDARILSNDLGAVLAEKLAWMVDPESDGINDNDSQLPSAYTLVFDNFTPEDMLDVEEYLVIFSDYVSHRPIYSGNRRSEIWYESTIRSAKMNRNLRRMMQELDLKANIQFSGNTFTVKKITLRGKDKPTKDRGDW